MKSYMTSLNQLYQEVQGRFIHRQVAGRRILTRSPRLQLQRANYWTMLLLYWFVS